MSPAIGRARAVSAYAALLGDAKRERLLDRRPGYYISLTVVLSVLLVATAVIVVLLRQSWWDLLAAAALGILMTQFGFLAHEAGHRQVFASGRANDLMAALVGDLVVGMSATWWNDGHARHHGNPNRRGADPAVEKTVVSFVPEDAAATRGIGAVFTRHQGSWFFPLLLLEGLNLHLESWKAMFRRRGTSELPLLLLRFAILPGSLFLFMPPIRALAFFAVELGVFGIYVGSSFAINHIGMPILTDRGTRDYLTRQVVTSRNIRSGRVLTAAMGGLNYQIEHHLFPSMPRPALARARELVLRHCAEQDLPYTERGLFQAFGDVVAELNRVGLAAGRNPWVCPTAERLRRVTRGDGS